MTRISLRIDDEQLHAALRRAAEDSRRSLNDEILMRLERTLRADGYLPEVGRGVCRIAIDWRQVTPEWREALLAAIGRGDEAALLLAPLIPVSDEDEREEPVRSMALPVTTQYQRDMIARLTRFVDGLPGPSPVSIDTPGVNE